MYKLALALATSLFLCACSDPAATSVDCSKGEMAGDSNTFCGDNITISAPTMTTETPPPDDAGADDPCGAYAFDGPWIRSDGSKAMYPKFLAASDGHEWIDAIGGAELNAGDRIWVLIQQAGPDVPLVPATLAIEIYDNTDGWSDVYEVVDEPTRHPHALSMTLGAKPRAESLIRVVVQAPLSNAGEDAALWFMSTPVVDPLCL